MKIYIAGPMTGFARYNVDAFDAAAAEWRERGHEATTPADITRWAWDARFSRAFDPDTDRCEYGDAAMCELLAHDLAAVCHADAIAVLPGWHKSKGAKIEIATARALGKVVYDAETFTPLDVEIQTTPLGLGVPREAAHV